MGIKDGDDIIDIIYRMIYKNRKHRPDVYHEPQRFKDITDIMDN
jgi:hypothetical protein